VGGNPDPGQLRGPSGPVKAKSGSRDGRRRRRPREVAEDEHPVAPDQAGHLHGVKGDVAQQRRDVPLASRDGAPHQEQRHGWVAICGGVHPATVTRAAWLRLGRDLAGSGGPAK